MDPKLLAYAEATAPRYTSYPTAPHFSDAVNGETARAWLGALAPDAALSLYLHVPFCRDICWYCGCHTFAARRPGPVADYAKALGAEIGLVAEATPARGVRQIHWGGGTPNSLAPEDFARLAALLRTLFDLSAVDEHAVEIDPRTLSDAHVAAFARAGVTRASLGVQDVNAHVQAAIGRVQPTALVADAVARLRGAGVAAINFDLMYGLPHQSMADARESARQAAALGPDRLAAFGYAHVPWFKTRQRLIDAQALPGAAERMDQAETIRETLEAEGYVAIGFDHFARPEDPLARAAREGGLTRTFQGYAGRAGDALIGFGASAISTYPQGYAQNTTDVAKWATAVREGRLATARGVHVSDEDQRRRAIIEALLCAFAVDLAPFGGLAAFPEARAALSPLAADGLVDIAGDVVRVSPRGRPFARLAACAFDAYHAGAGARHSKAV